MAEKNRSLTCIHCDAELKKVDMPVELAWGNPIQYVCFNDECSYFLEGWDWMWENYRNKVSYRYRVVNPETGTASPLMVWSIDAIKDRIIED